MKTSRRNFIKIGATAVVFAGTNLLTPVFSSAQESSADFRESLMPILNDPLANLTSEDFEKYVGTEFSFITDKQTASAVLSNVTQVIKPVSSARRSKKAPRGNKVEENFMLSFQLSEKNFSQATYLLWHPSIGHFSLFLVPGERKQNSLHAVINRV